MFESLMKNKYFNDVVAFLKENKLFEDAYLVGGSVRDLLLKRELKDLDFAIKGDSLKVGREFSKKIGGKFVLLDEVFSVGRIVKDDITIDFSELRGGSIEADLSMRDFTINAMALSLSRKNLIDPFEGLKDIKNKTIRMVSEENLKADPLRILRAYRFIATLDFIVDNDTRKAMKKNIHLIKIIAKERIKEELWKILSENKSSNTVSMMVEDRIFNALFKTSDLVPLNPSVEVLINIENILNNPAKTFSTYKTINSPFNLCLKFAGLFNFHAPTLIKQIKPSKKEERFIEKLIEGGVRIRKIETLLDKVKFLKDYEDILYPVLIYGISKDPFYISRAWFYREIESFYRKHYLKNKKKLSLITGEDILSLGFEPSPLVGEILERIKLLILTGKISNKQQAIEEIKKFYLLKTSPP
jgi:tRNA nucleotidyltransferase/poly(A) polymerase